MIGFFQVMSVLFGAGGMLAALFRIDIALMAWIVAAIFSVGGAVCGELKLARAAPSRFIPGPGDIPTLKK